ncbi:MAG: type IV pilus secretin PilQ [Syntrophales bacterium]|nr:type IV pilus secretin PilQ [Syntrophales bacterium]
MGNASCKRKVWAKALILILTLLWMAGCASTKAAKEDPFFSKWHTLAETATGSSPQAKKKASSILQDLMREPADGGTVPAEPLVRVLPTQPVNIKMRQADIKAILRSLAKIANRNILVKNDIKGEMTIDFQGVPWNHVFTSILKSNGLTYDWEGEIIRVMTLDDMEVELKRKTHEQGIQRVAPLMTVVVPIDYAKPKDLKESLEAFLTRTKDDKPRGSVRVDEHSNSLIISAIRDDLLKMLPIIEKIDKPTPQIMIKANIVETSKEVARELGIRWGGMYKTSSRADGVNVGNIWVTPGGMNVAPGIDPITGNYTPAFGSAGVSGHGFGVNFPIANETLNSMGGVGSLGFMLGTIGGNILEMQLQALQKDSKLNILSSPSIITRDNQTAYTENGERVPYVTNQTSGGTVTQSAQFQDVVLRLEITPHVIDENTLSMRILVKKDEVDASRSVQGNPFIIKKATETNLICQNGETIVISGLTKTHYTRGNTGLPWLKDIPILGWLVKSDSLRDKMEEVLIFITPNILPVRRELASAATAPAAAAPITPPSAVKEGQVQAGTEPMKTKEVPTMTPQK